MRAIAALINAGIIGLTGWFAATISAKIAAAIALAAIYISITVTALAAVTGLVAGIEMSVSAELTRAASWFMPDNAAFCLAALFSATMIRAVLNFQHSVIKLWSTALG
jgi:hypothetical protein